MLKNTDKEYKILQKNENLTKKIFGNIVVFSLAGILVGNVLAKSDSDKAVVSDNNASITGATLNDEYSYGHERYSFYQQKYLDAINHMKDDDFDQNFENICKSGKYIINNKQYSVREVYIVKCEDESVHLIKAGENNLDIITNVTFNSKKKLIMQFSNSKVFYDMYLDKLFNEMNIDISIDIFGKYSSNWNGEKHLATKEQMAYEEAHQQYQKKYGGQHGIR